MIRVVLHHQQQPAPVPALSPRFWGAQRLLVVEDAPPDYDVGWVNLALDGREAAWPPCTGWPTSCHVCCCPRTGRSPPTPARRRSPAQASQATPADSILRTYRAAKTPRTCTYGTAFQVRRRWRDDADPPILPTHRRTRLPVTSNLTAGPSAELRHHATKKFRLSCRDRPHVSDRGGEGRHTPGRPP